MANIISASRMHWFARGTNMVLDGHRKKIATNYVLIIIF